MRKHCYKFCKNTISLLLFPFPHAPSPLTPAANFLSPSNLKLPPLITCCSENLDFHIPSHQPFFFRTPQNLNILITPALCSCSFLEDGKEYTYDMEIYQVTTSLWKKKKKRHCFIISVDSGERQNNKNDIGFTWNHGTTTTCTFTFVICFVFCF